MTVVRVPFLLSSLLLIFIAFAMVVTEPLHSQPIVDLQESRLGPPFAFESPHERFCTVAPLNPRPEYVPAINDSARLNAGCYVNHFSNNSTVHANHVNYIPSDWQHIFVLDTKLDRYGINGEFTLDERIEKLKSFMPTIVERNGEGQLYAVGNEMDGDLFRTQLDVDEAEDYAQVYHELYVTIKELDPTSIVMIGGIIQPSPARLQYLDMVLSAYEDRYGAQLPTDAWNIHNIILREGPAGVWGAGIPLGVDVEVGLFYEIQDHGRIDIFRQNIVDFRLWMRDNGYRQTPLIITEYGLLFPEAYGFTESRVVQFMEDSFDYMMTASDPDLGYSADDDKLVQMWAWFSIMNQRYTPEERVGYNGELFDENGDITVYGETFAQYLAPDIVLESFELDGQFYEIPQLSESGLSAVVTMSNDGLSAVEDVVLRFWNGNPEDGGVQIGEDVIVEKLVYGDENDIELSVSLGAFEAGAYNVYVTVDPDDAVSDEKDETNNVGQVEFYVFEELHQLYIPTLTR